MWEQLESMQPTDAPTAPVNAPRPEAIVAPAETADPLANALHQCISRSVEEMTFLPVDRVTMMTAHLAILQPVRGVISLCMTPQQATRLATALHGNDATPLSETMIRDAMAELINTVAGQLASSLLSAEEAFTLGLPEVTVNARVDFPEPTRMLVMKQDDEVLLLALSGSGLFARCNTLMSPDDLPRSTAG